MWYCRNFVICGAFGWTCMLPIYFFTLIVAYKYGFKVGMLAWLFFSPLVNSFLVWNAFCDHTSGYVGRSRYFGVDGDGAGYMADRFRKITIPALLGTVMAYQVVGTLIEWALVGDFYLAAQDFQLEFRACCSILVAMLC